ncbi:MAG: hypothetical protein KGJ32_02895 [Xanthomonadaceae bacterium]|nr:hypothetical protein [Xanthomonadaceae bacterium]
MDSRLDVLYQDMPDPFNVPRQWEAFLAHPVARDLLAGDCGIERLLAYLERQPEPPRARVAVILLSHCGSDPVYRRLLAVLEHSDQRLAEAFEPGFWLLPRSQAEMARDLAALVDVTHNPFPLLLLQRPVAAEVRDSLEKFIRWREMPLSAYALYAYAYVPEPRDRAMLEMVARWLDQPSLCSTAGLELLRMGSGEGVAGIRAGLQAADPALRETVYCRLGPYLAKDLVRAAQYDAAAAPTSQVAATDRLIDGLRRREVRP